jgi:hypothetical protein
LTGKSKTKFCSFLVQCLTKFNQILINSSLADGKCIQKISYEYVWYFLSYLAHRQTHIHTYTRTHIHTYTHTHIHTYTHTHIHTYTYTHTYTHIHTHIHTYTHTHIQTQMVIVKRAYTLTKKSEHFEGNGSHLRQHIRSMSVDMCTSRCFNHLKLPRAIVEWLWPYELS